MRGVDKYLGRWAEPEAALAAQLARSYSAVLVVPARGEEPSMIEGFRRAASAAPGRLLCVVVVNAPQGASAELQRDSERLCEGLCAPLRRVERFDDSACAWIGDAGDFDLLVVDRCSEGRGLPPEQGVGLARKLGCDLALALWRAGQVRSSLIYGTDADATLPERYFEVCEAASAARPRAAALVLRYWHDLSGDVPLDRATALYELWLRHHVLGLAAARSPYAYHAIGSTVVVRADAYAAVRGFPKRAAGEDFHLLGKLAKVGGVARVSGQPVRLRARRSGRTPYGTGASVARVLLDEAALRFMRVEGYELLGAWLRALDAFSVHRRAELLRADVRATAEAPAVPPAAAAVLEATLAELDARLGLERAQQEAPDPRVLRGRLHEHFDALRTLRFLHRLRDAAYPALGWREAMAAVPTLGALDPRWPLSTLRRRLEAAGS